MAVNEPCIEVIEKAYYWKIVRDFVKGEKTVKDAGVTYLPMKAGQNVFDYECYKSRAKVGDYTKQILNVMTGMIERKKPVIAIPENEKIKKIIEDFDNEGHSLYQHSVSTIHDNIQTFFGGLLSDAPKVDSNVSEYEAEQLGLHPYVKYYVAENIINWKFCHVGSSKKLSLVVLKELIDNDSTDEFAHDKVIQYRVLSLDKDGIYNVRLYKEFANEDKVEIGEPTKPYYPRFNGELLTEIPFEFLPGFDDGTLGESNLYGVAELHKHYYMQSADYENGVHFTTVPTLWTTGHDVDAGAKDDKESPLILGGDVALSLPEPEAKIGTVQFAGDGLTHSRQAKEETLAQIGILGSRSVAPDKNLSGSADAERIHRQGENANLATYARNVSEAYTKTLKRLAKFAGLTDEEIKIISVQFNVDYDSVAFDPNAINSIANLSREGKFPLPLVYDALKKGEYLPNELSLRDFMLLIQLELSGATPAEELEIYQKMLAGEKIDIPDIPVRDLEKGFDNEEHLDNKEISLRNEFES